MSQPPVTAAVADLLQGLWPAAQALPAPVIERARRLWLDTVSCAASGLQADEPQRWLALLAAGDAGPVPMPGKATRLGASTATLALAVGACWDEACEGLALAHGRPGVPVVAALWAEIGQRPTGPVSWQALWQATAVGYEVAARLGARLRMRPGLHVDGVWGAFGAAAALVYLRGGTAQDAGATLEACAVQLPFSLVRPARQGASIRNLYLGHSAWLGRQAALAVAAGLGTPSGAIDDVIDLMLAGAPQGHWPEAGPWCLLDSYWKPFAAVRHVHYGAQAALALRAQLQAEGGSTEAIDAIELTVYPEALQYCANRDPQTLLGAQFSLSFGVAAALRFGDLSPDEFRAPRFHEAELRRLERLLQVQADGQRFAGAERGARLALRHAGRWLHADQGPVTGDAGHQPDAAQVQRKFDRYTRSDPALARWADRVRHDPLQAPACHPEAPC